VDGRYATTRVRRRRAQSLIVNAAEAELVRGIFCRYAEHGSAAQLVRELAIEGQTTKSWVTQGGLHRPGRPIDQQYLFAMLRNRIYLGEMVHKGESYPGQHQAIVSPELWNAAHAFIERRKQGPREHRTEHPALLAGLLFAPDGQRMIHHFTKKKNGRLYRYYVPYLHKRRNAGATLQPGATDVGALPAAEIETAVLEQIHLALRSPEILVATWRSCQRHSAGADLDEAHVVIAMQRIGAVWEQLFPIEQQRITQLLIERIQLHGQGLDILWREDGWLGLGADIASHPLVEEMKESTEEAFA
jgi:site-specific DNA recombinase